MNVYFSRALLSYMIDGKRAVIVSNNMELISISKSVFESICFGMEKCCNSSNKEFILKFKF